MGAKKNKKKKGSVGSPQDGPPPPIAVQVPPLLQPSNYTPSATEEEAMREIGAIEKKKGNIEYLKKHYAGAIHHYTRGISVSAKHPTLLTLLLVNRGVTYLRWREYHCAVEDASDALSLDNTNIRAHIVLAFGHFFMQHFAAAFEVYDVAVKLQPQTPALQAALQRALASLSAQHKKIKEAAMQSAKTGKKLLREALLEWLGDFGLLAIDEEPLPNPELEHNYPSIPPSLISALPAQEPPIKSVPARNLPNPISAPAANAAIAWAPPTSVKSELIGNANLELEEVPPLVASGDSMYNVRWDQPFSVYMQTIINKEVDDRERLAELAKVEGNRLFQEQKFKAAIGHYSKALILGSTTPKGQHVYYSNRAQAYLKLHRWSEAITDCTLSICCNPTAKAYMRRATARANLNMNLLAVQDYRNALHIDHQNLECVQEFEKLLKKVEEELIKEPSPANNKVLTEIKEERKQLATLKLAIEANRIPASTTPSSFSSSSSSSYASSSRPSHPPVTSASININIKPQNGKPPVHPHPPSHHAHAHSPHHIHPATQFSTTISSQFGGLRK